MHRKAARGEVIELGSRIMNPKNQEKHDRINKILSIVFSQSTTDPQSALRNPKFQSLNYSLAKLLNEPPPPSDLRFLPSPCFEFLLSNFFRPLTSVFYFVISNL